MKLKIKFKTKKINKSFYLENMNIYFLLNFKLNKEL